MFLQTIARRRIQPGLESAVANSGVFTSKNWLSKPENQALLKLLVRKGRFGGATANALLEDGWKGSRSGGSLHRDNFAQGNVTGASIWVLRSEAVPTAEAVGLLIGRMDAGNSTSQVDSVLSLLPPDHWLKFDPGIFKVLKHSLRVSPGETAAVARVMAGLGPVASARFKTMTAIVLHAAQAQGEARLRVTAYELFKSAQFLQRPDAIKIKRESVEITGLNLTIQRRFLKTSGLIAHSMAASYIA